MRSQYIDLQGAFVHVPNSNWFHPQVYWFVHSQFHVSSCFHQDFIISNRVLSAEKKIWRHEPFSWWDCEIESDSGFTDGELKPLNALWDIHLSDGILDQHEELALSFLHTLMKPRWIIWHSLELRECSNWKPQSTELIAIPACVKPSDGSAIKKSNWFSTFVLSFRLK